MRFGFWEIILIIVLIMVLFGHSKFPSIMKNLAEGINIFKKEMKSDEEKVEVKKEESPASLPKPAPVKKSPSKKPAVKKAAAKKTTKK